MPTAAGRSRWRRFWSGLHSRFARHIALAVVAVSGFAAVGHFIGGLLGWWHAYELAAGGHERGNPGAAQPRSALQDLPLSIVVLPFANDGAPEEGRFIENLTNDVAVQISRLPGSAVIGRETAASWSGRDADPRQIARDLGVRYVLSGSAQRDGHGVRLRVTLINGETGARRWAEQFDVERVDLPRLVDDVAFRLGTLVYREMTRSAAEAASRLPPELARAEDIAMQGWSILFGGVSRESTREALALFDKAVAMDDRSVRGWAGVGASVFYLMVFRWAGSDAADSAGRLREAADRLERLDPEGSSYYGVQSSLGMISRDWPGLLAISDRWVQRFPGSATAHSFRSIALLRMDRFEETLAALDRAIALDPLGVTNDTNKWRRAFVLFALHRYGEAVEWARQASAGNRRLPLSHPTLAAALARAGKVDEGHRVLASYLQDNPGADEARLRRAFLDGDGPRFAAARDQLIGALRELGLP